MQSLLYTSEQLTAVPAEVLFEHAYEGTPFSVKGLKCPEDKPGHWSTMLVQVYREGILLGGYRRMYSSFGKETFMPFKWGEHWYALYSANYTCTRVLRLNAISLEDWCGEDPSAGGFCPAEFYAPQVYRMLNGEDETWQFYEQSLYASYPEFVAEAQQCDCSVDYPGFAFLSGCHWGDDSSWKLRYVDYSKIEDKIMAIDERFGYHPLPNQPLASCVDLSCWEPDFPIIRASKLEQYCIR
jgi:hypothetical protein